MCGRRGIDGQEQQPPLLGSAGGGVYVSRDAIDDVMGWGMDRWDGWDDES